MHAQPSDRARCLIFGQTLRPLPYFMCANSEGSGETVRMRKLTWAFAGRLWLRPDMTEKLLTGTLSLNTNKQKFMYIYQRSKK